MGVGCTTMLLSQRQCGGAARARCCHWAGSRTKASGSARQETKARRKTHAPWIFDPYFGFRVVDNVKCEVTDGNGLIKYNSLDLRVGSATLGPWAYKKLLFLERGFPRVNYPRSGYLL